MAKDNSKILYQIIGAAMEVYRELNYGLWEPVYQEALSLVYLQKESK